MTFRTMTAAVAMLALTAPIVSAGGADDDTLTINGDLEITTKDLNADIKPPRT